MALVKLIVSDLDGTLLRSDSVISDHTKSVLARCRAAGVKIVYATGRGGSADRVAPAELFDGRIIQNGAVAVAGDDVIYKRLIPYETARPVLLALDRRGLRTASENGGMHYSNFTVTDEWPRVTDFKTVDFSKHSIDAEKLDVIVHSPEDAVFVEKNLPEDLYLTVSRAGLGQIMHRDATKAKALAELARVWGIDRSEIVAFGDDLNDRDMLEFAGTGIAMGNAHEEIKTHADIVCLNNDEDGVAEWLLRNAL